MSYPGGKAGAGVYQAIINQIPPHGTYIEAFAGAAAVLKRKSPAPASIAIDADAAVVDELRGLRLPGLTDVGQLTSTTAKDGDSGLRDHIAVYGDPAGGEVGLPPLMGDRVGVSEDFEVEDGEHEV